jgi:hypothetical protein
MEIIPLGPLATRGGKRGEASHQSLGVARLALPELLVEVEATAAK